MSVSGVTGAVQVVCAFDVARSRVIGSHVTEVVRVICACAVTVIGVSCMDVWCDWEWCEWYVCLVRGSRWSDMSVWREWGGLGGIVALCDWEWNQCYV